MLKANQRNIQLKLMDIKREARKVIANYWALYSEHKHKKKLMLTITPTGDSEKQDVFEIRKFFFYKLNQCKRNKKDGDMSIAYFSNIELGEFNTFTHLHIQFFYTDQRPIDKALQATIKKFKLDSQNIIHPDNEDTDFYYVIKEYININAWGIYTRKQNYKFKNMTTSSYKKLPSYLIKYFYKIASKASIWKDYQNKYLLIKRLVNEDVLFIDKIDDTVSIKDKEIELGTYRVSIDECKLYSVYQQEATNDRQAKNKIKWEDEDKDVVLAYQER